VQWDANSDANLDYSSEEKVARRTISVSRDARQRIDERAAQLGVTRSAFVELLVAADAAAELERALEEGYRATSRQNLEFAEGPTPRVGRHGP
jgi:hypothetical protein